jgi:2-polyprenyl-6-methoxyphenol hydroxylase-like FAD-dependent oxidoreductase
VRCPFFRRERAECSLFSGGDGALLGKHEWTEEILHECGGDYLFVQHADLRALLLSAARANGVSIRFSSNVTSVGSAEACVTLSSGEVVEGDVVVAANGAESIIRSALCEGEEEVIRTPNLVLFRYSQTSFLLA